jgi:hypothetical protein
LCLTFEGSLIPRRGAFAKTACVILIVILQRLMRALQRGTPLLSETPRALKFSIARLLHPCVCIAICPFRLRALLFELGSYGAHFEIHGHPFENPRRGAFAAFGRSGALTD